MKKIIYLGVSMMMVVLAGCSSSKITSSWKPNEDNNNAQSAVNFKKIVVVGLFNDSSRELRQQMEDQLAGDLKAEGFNAVTSLSVYGPKSFQNMKEGDVINQLNENGIDGVITISLVDKNKEKRFVAGPRYYRPYAFYNPYRPYGWGYSPFYNPYRGHYETNANFVFETNLYDVSGKKLIYSAQSQSYSPSSVGAMADDYSKSVVKDMKKNNILG